MKTDLKFKKNAENGVFEAEFEANAPFTLHLEMKEPTDVVLSEKSGDEFTRHSKLQKSTEVNVEVSPAIVPKTYKIESKTAPKKAVAYFAY